MRYVIIGGVAGGASAAARLRRNDEKAEIILLEKGAHISYANCGLPYYIGDVINDRNKLFVQTATSFRQRFNIDTRVLNEATGINPDAKEISVRNLETGETYNLSYDKLILSPGASPVRPPLPGIDLPGIFTLRNVDDTDRIKEFASKFKRGKAVVIGAGFIGLEMAENLKHTGMDVTIVEMGNQVLAPADFPVAAFAQQHIRSKGVQLRLSTTVSGFRIEEGQLLVDLKGEDSLKADLVILSIGVRPDSRLAEMARLETGPFKGIVVNEYLQTSNKDIYAVGDAIEFKHPLTGKSIPAYLAGPANKQGRICANNIVYGNNEKYAGAYGTAIVKLFDLTAAVTGMASKHLEAAGIPHEVTITHSGSHAGYYPDAEQMTIQLNFAPETGKILGAQAIGKEGVDKRIDVISAIMRMGGTVHDLAEFEHAYAPPFSSAKDPVNMAGFVAGNVLAGTLRTISSKATWNKSDYDILLDVRNPDEYQRGHIPGAINIPVDELRSKLSKLSPDKKIIIYCQIGLRGYLAQRILMQNGFNKVMNISGGYKLWEVCQAEMAYQQAAS